ncbi:MAG: sugar ABC transporter permease [Syntrophomonadaceae bacterium]|nr:sugar ABC transporter permease [Syntrophomonadaceae bacterium]
MRHSKTGLLRVEQRDGVIYAMPFILGVLLFWAGPMLYSLFLIVNDWNMINPPKFVGAGNLVTLAKDSLVGTSLWNTAYYTFLGVPIRLVAAFGLAVALNAKIGGRSFYRTAFYLPSITPAVASAVIWIQMFNPEFGVINSFLDWFGIPAVRWLYDPVAAKPAFILMSMWGVGPQMIIFLAGLQNVSESLLEAAQLDGANAWDVFRHVTMPMVSSTILFNFTMGIIGSFQVFAASFVMTSGGPQNSTLFMVLYIYDTAFKRFRMGYSATLAWLLFFIIMIVTFLQMRITDRWVYYEVG